MKPIFGEYDVKIDSKGRFLLPAALLKQLPEGEREEFVLNRGLDMCLTLYPIKVWEEKLQEIYAKNQYVEKNRTFARMFQSGAAPVSVDGQGRVLVPKRLLDFAKLDKDLILVGAFDKIEIWAAEAYDQWSGGLQTDMAALSEEVMGGEQNG